MVAPILEEHTSKRDVYFPINNWYDLSSGTLMHKNEWISITNELNTTAPAYLKEGSLVLLQNGNVSSSKQLNN